MHANFIYGDLSKFGIHRPKIGPFTQKAITGRSPVIDVGTVKKIQGGEIRVGRFTLFFFFFWIIHEDKDKIIILLYEDEDKKGGLGLL